MKVAIAFYKGPPRNDWWHTLSHYAIRLWTWSRYSHAELVINGMCYSSSARDGGVRNKVIDLTTGRWDVVEMELPDAQVADALWWFSARYGQKYDWLGIARWVLPLLGQDKNRWFCFEAVGASLGMAGSYRLDADDLYEWAKARAV